MRRLGALGLLAALVAGVAGCSPFCVDVSLEGVNWYIVHPRLECFHCPYANPDCPYYDYHNCEWGPGVERPPVSAVNAPAAVPKLEEVRF